MNDGEAPVKEYLLREPILTARSDLNSPEAAAGTRSRQAIASSKQSTKIKPGMQRRGTQELIEAETFTTLPGDVRILVIDDDPAMQRMIVGYLTDHGLHASAAPGRQGLLRAFSSREPDVVILDLHLGEDDGLELLRELRTRSVVPVILITGNRREEIDHVLGLELGADDYLTKPFGLRELLARVRAVLRRRVMDRVSNAKPRERSFRFAGWTFDQRRRKLVSPGDEIIALTKSEFALLSSFVLKARQILSREYLLQSTRVHEDMFDRSIDVQILRLRRKIEKDPHDPRIIRTERGVGYIFDVDVEVM
jgi:DNA-binding response OmpR family regulator